MVFTSYRKFYVYTLLSLKDFNLYTGFTTDLKRRLDEHSRGLVDATQIRIPFKLVHYEYFVDEEDARRRMYFLKTNTGKAELKNSLQKTLKTRRSMPYRFF